MASTSSNGSAKNPVPVGTVLSLAIPWLENNDRATGSVIDEEFVRSVFDKLGVGEISQIDLVKRGAVQTPKFKRAHQKGFVHYTSLTADGERVAEHLGGDSVGDRQPEIKVWYSQDYFWKARKSTFVFQEGGGSPPPDAGTFKPRVEF